MYLDNIVLSLLPHLGHFSSFRDPERSINSSQSRQMAADLKFIGLPPGDKMIFAEMIFTEFYIPFNENVIARWWNLRS